MKLLEKLAQKVHDKLYAQRCEIRPGIRYFDETHFPELHKDDFEFTNTNWFTLRGGYYYYDNFKEDTIVIFCHGMGGGHQAYMKEIEYIARAGFKVLAVDYQGTILSDGDRVGSAGQALKDMDTMVDVIKDKFKHIYVVGHSWGSWVAQGLAYIQPTIEKVVMLAPMESLESCFSQHAKWPLSIILNPFLKIEGALCPKHAHIKARFSLNRNDLKGLVIQSHDDNLLAFNKNFKVIKENVTNKNIMFIDVEGKGHNPAYTFDAVKLLADYMHKLNKCKNEDEANKLADTIDWDKICEIDPIVMDKVTYFLQN